MKEWDLIRLNHKTNKRTLQSNGANVAKIIHAIEIPPDVKMKYYSPTIKNSSCILFPCMTDFFYNYQTASNFKCFFKRLTVTDRYFLFLFLYTQAYDLVFHLRIPLQ